MASLKPYWPAALNRKDAALYLSLTPAQFEAAINEEVMPLPIKVAGKELWIRRQLDEALEALNGGGGDWETRLGLRVA